MFCGVRACVRVCVHKACMHRLTLDFRRAWKKNQLLLSHKTSIDETNHDDREIRPSVFHAPCILRASHWIFRRGDSTTHSLLRHQNINQKKKKKNHSLSTYRKHVKNLPQWPPSVPSLPTKTVLINTQSPDHTTLPLLTSRSP